MPIDLDTRLAIRHPDLGRIVRAVVGADTHDEADWLEWKSELDLSTKKGCFPIARAILGMANRPPATASLVCEGLGYVVVGAEPGNLCGIVSVDPADLDQILEPWLGGVDGPRYVPAYVVVDSKKVLVVVVEAPQQGDPIYTLQKEFDGSRDGDVFVRKLGRTERANSGDMRALVERAVASDPAAPELEVSLVGDLPLPWFDLSTRDANLGAWIDDRRRAMVTAAQTEERLRQPEPKSNRANQNDAVANAALAEFARQRDQLERLARDASRLARVAGLVDEPDRRTLSDYLAEVDSWCARATEVGPGVVQDRYLRAGHGLVAVRVRNPTGRYLPKVMVEVHFECESVCSPELEYVEAIPTEPRPYGAPTPSPLARSLSFTPQMYSGLVPSIHDTPLPARSWTEEGSVTIVFDVGDLRQESVDTSDSHYLFLTERPPGGLLHATWKATIPEVHGVIRGSLNVPVQVAPVDFQDLLNRSSDDDG